MRRFGQIHAETRTGGGVSRGSRVFSRGSGRRSGRRPAAYMVHSAASQQPQARRTCTHTSSVGRWVSYYRGRRPLEGQQHAEHGGAAAHQRVGATAARQPPYEHRRQLNTNAISAWRWITKSIVPRPSKSRRSTRSLGAPGRGPAAVAAGRRRSSRAQRDERVGRPHERTIAPGGTLAETGSWLLGGGRSAARVARRAGAAAATRISIESAKWPITQP